LRLRYFYTSQAAYNCYLLPNGVTEQSRRHAQHDVTAGLHCWQYWTKFLLYPQMAVQINKLILHASPA